MSLKNISLNKLNALSFLKASSNVSDNQTVFKKPLFIMEAAFFPRFISAQHVFCRTPMNGSLIYSANLRIGSFGMVGSS